jgi:hypothetical protein
VILHCTFVAAGLMVAWSISGSSGLSARRAHFDVTRCMIIS